MFASVEVQKKSRGKNNHVPVHTDVYTVLLPSSKMSKVSDQLRSILCRSETLDLEGCFATCCPNLWMNLWMPWIGHQIFIQISILKYFEIYNYMLYDFTWSFHFSVKYGYSRMEGDGKFCWWFLCCHCKKIRSDKREPCT